MKAALSAVLACLLIAGAPVPAQARPGPRWTPTPVTTEVWLNVAEGAGHPAYWAAGFVNRFTRTKLACATSSDPTLPTACTPTPCPNGRMCLRIRWAEFADDTQDARFRSYACTGGCTKSGIIELNPDGPLYGDGPGWWGPQHRRLLLEQQIGIFAGLTVQTNCVSSMSSWICEREGFTPAEAAHLAGW